MKQFVFEIIIMSLIVNCTGITKNEMFVNGQRMNTSYIYENGYREEVNYFFREGELAEIECCIRWEHSVFDAVNITTVLHENNRPALFSTHMKQQKNTWYIKLTEEFNGSHIDCNAQLSNGVYTIQLNLLMLKKDNVDKLSIIYVNDLILAPVQDMDSGTYKYRYLFYRGELLTITGVMIKNPNRKCHIKNYSDNIPKQLEEFGKNGTINMTITAISSVRIKCDDIVIIFNEMYEFCPFITGLSMAQTHLKYQNRTNFITKYDNRGKKTLQLRCLSYAFYDCKWKYNETEVIASYIQDFILFDIVFEVKEKYSNTTIACTCYDNEEYIEDGSTVVEVFNMTLAETEKSDTASGLWWIISAVIPIILIITVSKFMVHRKKCTQSKNSNNDPPGCANEPEYEQILYPGRNTTVSDIVQRPPLPPPNLPPPNLPPPNLPPPNLPPLNLPPPNLPPLNLPPPNLPPPNLPPPNLPPPKVPPAPDSALERATPDIAKRPPLPLPDLPLASDSAPEGETNTYYHYDSPYEERLKLMLMMNPPIRPPDKCSIPDIAQRPPLPLPDLPLASDSAPEGETPKYIHYDTPYEE